jgi:hypothetical protein
MDFVPIINIFLFLRFWRNRDKIHSFLPLTNISLCQNSISVYFLFLTILKEREQNSWKNWQHEAKMYHLHRVRKAFHNHTLKLIFYINLLYIVSKGDINNLYDQELCPFDFQILVVALIWGTKITKVMSLWFSNCGSWITSNYVISSYHQKYSDFDSCLCTTAMSRTSVNINIFFDSMKQKCTICIE